MSTQYETQAEQYRFIQTKFLERVSADVAQARTLLKAPGTENHESLRRILHSLKGAAGSCGFAGIGEYAARAESKLKTRFARKATVFAFEKIESERLIATKQLAGAISNIAPMCDTKGASFVLCIEDDPDIAQLVRMSVSNPGLRVEVSQDGFLGWERLLHGPKPEVILLDLMLPGLSGFEVLRRIRASEQLSDVPVVILSARVLEDEIDNARSMGANAFLAKPFDIDELSQLVTDLMAA